jgi:cytochrome bd ubiquinol oxidase subunit II
MESSVGGQVLPVIWACIMAFVILAYVVLDGFDLGIGILFAFEKEKSGRDVMVNSIAPLWDGNETWLVLGGAGLYGAFPTAYSIILPAFYPLIIFMVLGLIFRGVAFEFRFRAPEEHRKSWDLGFCAGSVVAAFCQGMILGGLLHGISSRNGQFAGPVFAWLRPFPLFCGVAVVAGYTMLGAAWMYWRAGGALQQRMRKKARQFGLLLIAIIGIVSCWSPILNPVFFQRWFALPGLFVTAIAPIAVLAIGVIFLRHLAGDVRPPHDATPFFCGLGLFVVCFLGLGYSIFPLIVPPNISIWDAAAPPNSQRFLLAGTIVLLPVILAYNGFAYWIFRGKVETDAHYH